MARSERERSPRTTGWVEESNEPVLGTACGWEVQVLWGPWVMGTPSQLVVASPWGETLARSSSEATTH